MKNGLFMTIIDDRLSRPRRSSITLPKAKVSPKESHGDNLMAGLITTSWILIKSLQLKSTANKLTKYTKIFNVCVQHWLTEMILSFSFIQLRIVQSILQKLNELIYEILFYPYSSDLLPIDYHFFKHLDNFLHEKCFKSRRNTETAFKEAFVVSRIPEFYLTGIRKLFSHCQKCIDCNDFYFDR